MADSKLAEGGIVSDEVVAKSNAYLRDTAGEVVMPLPAGGITTPGSQVVSIDATPSPAGASITAMVQAAIAKGASVPRTPMWFANGPTQTYQLPPKVPTNPMMAPFLNALNRMRAGTSELMHDFWAVNQGVAPGDSLFTPVFGLCLTAPANATTNVGKAVPISDMVKKYKLDADLIRVCSRLAAGLMVGHVGTIVGDNQPIDAVAANPILEAISAVMTKNIPYEGAHPEMYEAAKEAIDDVINTACGNDLRRRAKMRTDLANGSDPKLIGHLMKAILGELVARGVTAEYNTGTLTCSAVGMPLSVEHALDDLTLAMLEGQDHMLNTAGTGVKAAWGGPIACLIPNKGELNVLGSGVVRVPAFELYPLCMEIARLSGLSFYGVQESLSFDPLLVLSSAAAVCGCSFGVIWPTFYTGGLNYGAVDRINPFDTSPGPVRTGRVVVAREVHSQAVAKGLSCVSHDWVSVGAKATTIRAEKDVITLLGNAVCGQTDLILHDAATGTMRHGHTMETGLLKEKYSIGMPPSCGWTNIGRSGMLASARYQYEQVYLKHTVEATMLETRKYHKLSKA